ncbi:hypothetical protein FA15DRAFT_99357 [Coprinopsis marcescibilis]|uniref:Uncharacterized protein n=1 Tax=Coprinopsis marcescibilis TaxID=230819 RepID=A0A5C3KYK4_COPMA|nr:hypothetical protein FA15DRAFT_99357 [Coprinopsis marcescibilis]
MADYSRPPVPSAIIAPIPLHPSPQYRTESPVRSFETNISSRKGDNLDLSNNPYAQDHQDRRSGYYQPSPNGQNWEFKERSSFLPHLQPVNYPVRDSGYGSAASGGQIYSYPQQAVPPAQYYAAPVNLVQNYTTDHAYVQGDEMESVSDDKTLLNEDDFGYQKDYEGNGGYYKAGDEGTIYQHPLYTPPHLEDPVLVRPSRADDYVAQRPQTPSSSNVSFQTYFSRFKQFVDKVRDLPWSAPERVTTDYYPGTAKHSARHLRHRPLLVWRNPEFYAEGYESSTETDSSVESTFFADASNMPHPGNPYDLDLGDEFGSIGQQSSSTSDGDFTRPNVYDIPQDLTRQLSTSTNHQRSPARGGSGRRVGRVNPESIRGGTTVQGGVVQAARQQHDSPVFRYPDGYVPYDQVSMVERQYGQPIHRTR